MLDRSLHLLARDVSDVFSREAKITIKNKLNTSLKRTSINTKNGHFKKGSYGAEQKPAETISAGGVTTFIVNNEGFTYVKGPEGTVTYTATSPIKGVEDVKIVIYWEHPLGPTKSTYNVSSVPAGLVKYTSYPPADAIAGWKQDIELIITEA